MKTKISIKSLINSPWLIHPKFLPMMSSSLLKEGKEEVNLNNEKMDNYTVTNGKAVINVEGIFYNKCMVDESWEYVICDLESELLSAVDNPEVREVILKIYSPGGVVYGISEVHDLIKDLKDTKPIYAFVEGMACSAAYWIASACTSIFTYEQNDVGSIGVYAMHVEYSQFLKDLGVNIEFVKAGKYKVTGNSYEPLSEEGRAYLQKGVDQTYKDFYESVANDRGLKIEEKDKWAEGQVFETKEALKLGLIDGIKTWQEILGYKKHNFSLKGAIMAIGETKISDLTVNELQEKNPDLYSSVLNLGKEKADEELKSKLAKYEEDEQKRAEENKIKDFAKNLNLVEEGDKLISEGKSVVESFSILAEKAKNLKDEERNNFTESAAETAGLSGDNIADDAPKTSAEAIEYCRKTYNLSKRAAWRKARVEFSSLFGGKKEEE